LPDIIEEAPLVLPRSLWEDTVKHYHEPAMAGHRKFNKLYQLLWEKYYFPRMSMYIKYYAQTCLDCQKATHMPKPASPLKPFHVGYPGLLVHLDYTKGTGTTIRGNTHILAVIDNFSGYVKLYATTQPEAKATATCLLDYIATNSMPVRIKTDNGSEFANQMVAELCYLLGLKQCFIAPHNSKANGKVENIHKTIKTMIRSYIQQYKDNWDLLLPLLEFAINTSESEVTTYTPFYLWFGRHPTYPLDTIYGDTYKPVMITDDYVRMVQSERTRVFNYVRDCKELNAKKMAVRYNRKFVNRMKEFRVGQYVLKLAPKPPKGENRKMHEVYGNTIYRIVKNNNNGTYAIEDVNTYEQSVQAIGQLKAAHLRYEHIVNIPEGTVQSGAIFEDVTHPEEGSDNDGNDFVEYEVKAILAERTKNGIHEYKVWWKNY
jgi:transposase InsO family protein